MALLMISLLCLKAVKHSKDSSSAQSVPEKLCFLGLGKHQEPLSGLNHDFDLPVPMSRVQIGLVFR